MVWLVWTVDWQTDVVGLGRGEGGELDVELLKMGSGDLLIERLGEHAMSLSAVISEGTAPYSLDTERVRLRVGPEGDLGHDLVGERTGHD